MLTVPAVSKFSLTHLPSLKCVAANDMMCMWMQFKRAFRRNDKPIFLAATQFLAHLVNQMVAHELLALELLMVLLENPSNSSVEVAVSFTKEVGATLQELSPQGLHRWVQESIGSSRVGCMHSFWMHVSMVCYSTKQTLYYSVFARILVSASKELVSQLGMI